MPGWKLSRDTLVRDGREHAVRLFHSRRARRYSLVLAALLVLIGLLGAFAAPPLIKSQLQQRLGTALHRPVTIGAVHLNPYTLKLTLDRLHIGSRQGTGSFVDVGQLVIDPSWSSLFHWAPVLDELTIRQPRITITRTAPQTFNFSDLLQGSGKPSGSPLHFAIANIRVLQGSVVFDDKVLGATHHVDDIDLGIPFIANLPHDTNVFVKPLVAMRIDGSPLHIAGETKPFADSRESTLHFTLNRLDLPRYLGYIPAALPVAIPHGFLSGQFQLHFITQGSSPQIKLDGLLQLDQFALVNHDGTPILDIGHGSATLQDIEPLRSRYWIGLVTLDHTTLNYTRLPGGHSNLDALLGSNTPPPAKPAPPTDARIAQLDLHDDALIYTDRTGTDRSSTEVRQLALQPLNGSMTGFAMLAALPAKVDLTASVGHGQLHLGGVLSMAKGHYAGQASMAKVDLAPLLALAPPMLDASISQGTLSVQGQLVADWSKQFDLQLDNAQLSVDNLALQRGHTTPVQLKSATAQLTHFDLADAKAMLDQVAVQGLQIKATHLRNGHIDLASLVKPSPSTPTSSSAGPSWQWQVAQLTLADSALDYRDAGMPGPQGRLTLRADKYTIDGLSQDMRKPLRVDLRGSAGRGTYRVHGTLRPAPLDANLDVAVRRLDLAPLESALPVPLNVRIDRALFSATGHMRYLQRRSQPWVDYDGRVRLGRVLVLDKLTGDEFLRWYALDADHLRVRLGRATPSVSVGALLLDDFYARVIVNGNGRLNLQDVVANPQQATPVSVTRANTSAAPAPTTTPATASSVPAAASSAPLPANIRIGSITLARGHLNYTDNFIKPNYTANITDLSGKIGAFGTDTSTAPAALTLQGELNGNAPVTIDGNINPLTPIAFLDVKGKASDVELSHLTPYSSKYTGYPITKGRLTMDVHYLLDHGKLKADNHIMLDQLTFGPRVEGPGIRHLPVKLAVALLRDPQGNIDVNVPVSGSLSDPEFSLGGVIWHAFVNLITRAITSPFRLLAAGLGGKHQDLGHVSFAPGSSRLDATAQQRLAEIVKVLKQKPALKLTITGRVDPRLDENGLRKETMDAAIRQEVARSQGDSAQSVELSKLSHKDYLRYLTKAYKHAKFSKPRDFIGLVKSQPPEVMENMIETHVTVNAKTMRALAERRASAVEAWLHGKIADNRMSVLAPKLDATGIDDNGKTTRVDFGLHD